MSSPWERQNGEPDAAFRAFATYRDLGPTRSLRAVTNAIAQQTARRGNASAVLVLPDELGEQQGQNQAKSELRKKQKHTGRVGEWSGKYNWVERARAWDDYLDRAALRKTLSTVERMAERHAKQNEQVLGVLMVPFVEFAKALQDKAVQTDPLTGRPYKRNDIGNMPASELLGLAIEAAKRFPALQQAERTARGVKVLSTDDPDAGTSGPAEWHVQIYQPEAKENPDAVVDEDPIPDAWEVDPKAKRLQDDDDED